MDYSISNLDWSLIRSFLAVAETGSLSAAARELGSSQPTIGRQIRQIEDTLNLTLFERRPRGLELSEAGQALLPHAQAMSDGFHALGRAAIGRSDSVSGPVRITASEFTAYHHLPAIIARIRQEEPEISVDVVATDRTENLLYREADIAVRMHQPRQLDIVTRHLGDLELGVYASESYLERMGQPASLNDMWKMDLVGYDRSDLIVRGMRNMGIAAQRDWFATRCDHHPVYWELIRAGCGIGFAQTTIADKTPGVTRLFPEIPLPTLPLWLAVHESLRNTPRIRRVWDILAEELTAVIS